MAAPYELIYYTGVPGRGEHVRLILEEAGVQYKDTQSLSFDEARKTVGGVTEPDFEIIAQCTRRRVFFQQAVDRLTMRFSQIIWIESGRGSVIQLIKDAIVNAQGHAFLSPQLSSSNAQGSLTDVTIELWKHGYAGQYWPFHRSQKLEYEHLSLPPYQSEKTRHWLPYMRRAPEREVEQDEKIEKT
ncbi:hypothetical protein NHQ30_007442 [Ciborinia camelliae]|nr:hypothetical protein NHQ30_007442 [Ciborinia camelliae]